MRAALLWPAIILEDRLAPVSKREILIGCFKNLVADESGATAIEYGLIGALVAIAAIVAMVRSAIR